MATPKKIATVDELTEKISKARSLVFADYRGLKHKQLEDLRRRVKRTQGEFVVAKNRLLLRSLGPQAASIKTLLTEATGTLFAYADEVAPVRELVKFFKDTGFGKTKGGLLGDQALTVSQVETLAKLPGKDVLLGQLVRQLNAPIQNLHYALSWNLNKLVWALQAVKEKRA